jgi:hypothetical protein
MTLATSSGVPARPSGNKSEQQPIAVHDMHATVLHPLGIDQTKLTYLFGSARESEKGVILRSFLKDDELGPGCGHALGFEQEVTEISIAAAAA